MMNARVKFMLPLMLAAFFFVPGCNRSVDYGISYELNFDTASHYILVDMTYATRKGEVVDFHLPVWAPGYYRIVDFPMNVSDFSAVDAAGRPLSWDKSGKSIWRVDCAGADTVRVSYRVYADKRSVAESRVGEEAAFIAPNGVFMYVDVNHPVDVKYVLPSQWSRISTAARPSGGEGCYTYPDFDVLYDQPLLLGNQRVIGYEQDGCSYELAFETPDGIDECSFVDDFKVMTHQCAELIGDIPYDKYCLIHLGRGQGGLEHTNSQACYTGGSFRFADRAAYIDHLLFTTHEYFHLYNVKTIRPIELGPFDYERENFTHMLWFSEGFTCYYESKILLEAGLITPEERLAELSGYIRNTESFEGHRHQSMRQFSYDIWLNAFNWGGNSKDVTISYYVKGPVVGLLFDCEIQRMSSGERSLDDLMRLLYRRYYKEKGRGFTEDEFWAATEEVAGGPVDVLRRAVDTTDEIDYDSILNPAGLSLDRESWTLSILQSER